MDRAPICANAVMEETIRREGFDRHRMMRNRRRTSFFGHASMSFRRSRSHVSKSKHVALLCFEQSVVPSTITSSVRHNDSEIDV